MAGLQGDLTKFLLLYAGTSLEFRKLALLYLIAIGDDFSRKIAVIYSKIGQSAGNQLVFI